MNKYKRVASATLSRRISKKYELYYATVIFIQATMTENVSQFYFYLYDHYLSLLLSHPRDILTRRSFISFYYYDDDDAGQIIYCICFVNSGKVKYDVVLDNFVHCSWRLCLMPLQEQVPAFSWKSLTKPMRGVLRD